MNIDLILMKDENSKLTFDLKNNNDNIQKLEIKNRAIEES